MGKKILIKDLQKRNNKTIVIDGGKPLSISKSAKKQNTVDLSSWGKKQFVLTNIKKGPTEDIKSNKQNGIPTNYRGEITFLKLESIKEKRPIDRLSELIRMTAVAILILFFINLINIYQRGVVVKNDIIASASSGYESIIAAGDQALNQDFDGAENKFTSAIDSFNQINEQLDFLQNNTNSFLIKEKTTQTVNAVLDTANLLASAGRDFSIGASNIKLLPEKIFSGGLTKQNIQNQKTSLTDELKQDLVYFNQAVEKINSAKDKMTEISPDVLPAQFREKITLLNAKITQISEILNDLQKEIPSILSMLGDRYQHRYLILLQNDSEARPTGGFIGSYIIADLNDGYLTKFEFHDVYDSDGQLQEYITPPPDIAKVSQTWRMRDSNYSPDFAISAEKAAWFLQKEKGPSVDTVIAVNQSFLADLLAIMGPVQVAGLNQPLTKDNYQIVLSYIIEAKLSGEGSPKQVLGKFITAVFDKFHQKIDTSKLITLLIKSVNEKKIQIYSRNQSVEELISTFIGNGKVISTKNTDDYLNVIATSIGGNKSDAFISQKITHSTLVMNDGSVANEVTVSRKHNWIPADTKRIKDIIKSFGFNEPDDSLMNILGRADNKSFIKIYVPTGSQLLGASSITNDKITKFHDDEIDKDYYMFEMDVTPGQEKTFTLSYKLPNKLNLSDIADSYRFFYQPQPGMVKSQLTKTIIQKPELNILKYYPESQLSKNKTGLLTFSAVQTKDLFLSALIGK